MSADTHEPKDLFDNHNNLILGSAFSYAGGALAFWSNSANVTCTGGGSCGYNSTTYPDVATGPTTSQYGAAAETLLLGRYALTPPTTSYITAYANTDQAFNAINNVTKVAGFVSLNRICDFSGRGGAWPVSGTAYVYPPTDTSVSPNITNYSPIKADAIRVKRSGTPRNSAENTVLANFIAFLQDFTVSPAKSPMVNTLEKFCFIIS